MANQPTIQSFPNEENQVQPYIISCSRSYLCHTDRAEKTIATCFMPTLNVT